MTAKPEDEITLLEIVIAAYDPSWPEAYEREKTQIIGAIGDVMIGIEHVGSTSVPRMPAKPIIDIMAGVRYLRDGAGCISMLAAIGYTYCGDAGLPGRLFFRKGNPRSHHLHIVEHSRLIWMRTLAFRELLKTRQDVATKYAALKRDLARNFRQDPRAYGEAKGPFIESMIARYTDDSAASPAEASAQDPPAVRRTPLTANARHRDHTPGTQARADGVIDGSSTVDLRSAN
jgi:GrpB-like predicted nucleotidyltransferase (UPF0157 family)